MGKGDGSCGQRAAMEIAAARPALPSPAELERLYSFSDRASGLRAVVTRVWKSRGRRHGQVVSGEILDGQGSRAGEFQRSLFTDAQGRLVVEHGSLSLQGQMRGRGFARRFNAACEQSYRSLGVDRIVLLAEKIGAYAWAHDYEFRTEWIDATVRPRVRADQAMRMLRGREEQIERLVADGRISRRLADSFQARFATPEQVERGDLDGKFQSPSEIADFGRGQAWQQDGQTMWLGKVFLIDNPWDAVKQL